MRDPGSDAAKAGEPLRARRPLCHGFRLPTCHNQAFSGD